MSRIDDLTARLAPNGVVFEPMGQVFEMKAGRNIRATAISPLRDDAHPFPCYGANGIRGYVAKYSHDGEYLLIGRQGALSGNVKVASGKFYATEHAVVTQPRSRGVIDVGWAYHLLMAMNLNQYVSQGAQPGLAVATLARVVMPIPPIAVQGEVAQVLDRIRSLTADLETELDAEQETRRLQYGYYRDRIITGIDARHEALRDLGNWRGGITPSKSEPRYWESGTIPWLASMDVSESEGRVIRGRVTPVALAETPLRMVPARSIVVVMRSNILRRRLPVGMTTIETTLNQDVRALSPRDGVDPGYVYQVLRAASEQIRAACVRADGSMAAVDSRAFFNWPIPVPSLKDQKRIANQLSTLEAVVSELSISLPAEIKARRKQYEYYRGRLLTFKALAA